MDPLRAPYYLQEAPFLKAETYGLQVSELGNKLFWIGDSLEPLLEAGQEWQSFETIMSALKRAYCGNIGSQYAHMTRANEKKWVERRVLEHAKIQWGDSQRRAILDQIANASYFEEFYGARLSGAKRFSLEGCEGLIPGLEALLLRSADLGIESIEMGMTHRGRLNVLRNLLDVPLGALLHNFQAYLPDDEEHPNNSDDVRYHLGTSVVRKFDGKKLRLSLAANPSHLESVNSVVLGKTRARQFLIRGESGDDYGAHAYLNNVVLHNIDSTRPPERRRGSVDYSPSDSARAKAMGLLLHGDASFFQGSVREVLGFSGLRDYATGGTVHVILNNQIGFTTLPKESHSGVYCTDVALSIGAPIFHVNGDDPDAVAKVCRTAVDYRHIFQRDCVVNLWGYRRHGHNEQDDPKLTQPQMYSFIQRHPKLVDMYAKTLLDEGVVEKDYVDSLKERIWAGFQERDVDDHQKAISPSQQQQQQPSTPATVFRSWNEFGALSGDPKAFQKTHDLKKSLLKSIKTGVEVELLRVYGQTMFTLPPASQFAAHPKVTGLYEQRLASIEVGGGSTIRWATAEALAFASLLAEGFHIRLSGQDVERGTFNQRHAVLLDQFRAVQGNEATYKPWTALQNMDETLQDVRNNMVKQVFRAKSLSASHQISTTKRNQVARTGQEQDDDEDEDGSDGAHAGHYFFPSVREEESTEQDAGPNENWLFADPDCKDYDKIDIELERIHKGVRLRRMQRLDSRRVLRWREPSISKRDSLSSEESASDIDPSSNSSSSPLMSSSSSASRKADSQRNILQLGDMEVCNSPLSEEAVLGFEHGYSLYSPNIMTIFEHQFGDFSNCAQTVIDTFVASGEEKWVRSSGLVILCPHGYEGQGPDHSSARVERFLQLCSEPAVPARDDQFTPSKERTALAEVNMHVLNMTTPAQYFHALRRQMLLPVRKPLVIFTPKYLLHHKPCASTLDELGPDYTFEPVISDALASKAPQKVRRVLLCSGKIWYHLSHKRKSTGLEDQVALVRIEQLCPFPFSSITDALKPFLENDGDYAGPVELCWVQEEPQNMGCWTYIEPRLRTVLNHLSERGLLSSANEQARSQGWGQSSVQYCGRPYSASPATGSFQVHQKEMNAIISAAFELNNPIK